MKSAVSKSKFKPMALQYFREVEKTGVELIISDRGKPVLKIVPYIDDPTALLSSLRGSVLKYTDPTKQVGVEDWSALT